MKSRLERAIGPALALAAGACLALAFVRICHSISFSTPLQLVTSGAEQEALDSIWRAAHLQPVFTDPHALPYTASLFNWLFYATYGAIAAATLTLFHLHAVWLPTVCRLVTLALTTAGAVIFTYCLRATTRNRLSWRIGAMLAVLAFFNPLCGFWIMTARPDLGAATFELAGVAFFLRHQRDGALRWILLSALALASAWACKQTAFGALAAISATLLWQRAYAAVLSLTVVWLAAAGMALAALGQAYRHELYLAQINSGFSLGWSVQHLGHALLKMPFIAAAFAALLFDRKAVRTASAQSLLKHILLLTLPLELALACKGGAGDYYFLPLGIWSAFFLGLVLSEPTSWRLQAALLLASAALIAAVAALFFDGGTLNPRDPRQPYEHLTRYLAGRPGPVLVQDSYGDLPWISSTAPHFVMAYNNEPDCRAGVAFERGGWRELLRRGYFATLVTGGSGEPIPPGLLASRYRFVRTETGWSYFERK